MSWLLLISIVIFTVIIVLMFNALKNKKELVVESYEPEGLDNQNDDDLKEIYIEESLEVLLLGKSAFTQWQNTQSMNDLQDFSRAMHTIKGGSIMLNISKIATLASELHRVSHAVICEEIDNISSVNTLMEEGLQILEQQIQQLEQQEDITTAQEHVIKLQAVIQKEES